MRRVLPRQRLGAALALIALIGSSLPDAVVGVRFAAAASGDLGRLQGSWTVMEATKNGKPSEDAELLFGTWTFQGNELLIDFPRRPAMRFVLTLERGAFHLQSVEPTDTAQSGWMLYSFEGNRLKIAFHDNLQRPSGFQPDASRTRVTLFVVSLAQTPSLARRSDVTALERHDLCAILNAAGIRQLLGGATPSCEVDKKKEDSTVLVLEAVAYAPLVIHQRLGGTVRVVVGVSTHPTVGRLTFERERERSKTHGRSQDEALGTAAFSTTSSQGHILRIVALKDETFVELQFQIPVGNPALVPEFAARVLANL